MNKHLTDIKAFCRVQLNKGSEDEFDDGVTWLAHVILDMIQEAEDFDRIKDESPIYEEQ